MSEFEFDAESVASEEAPMPERLTTKALSKAAVRNRRKVARNAGLRKHAIAVGITKKNNDSFHRDLVKSVFSPTEVKKMARQVPENCQEVITPMPLWKESCELANEMLGQKSTALLTKYVESFARSLAVKATKAMMDSGASRVTAWHVRSAALPLKNVMRHTDVFNPLAVVRNAQTKTYKKDGEEHAIVDKTEEDDAEIANEKKLARERRIHFKETMAAAESAKIARREARAAVVAPDVAVSVEVGA